MNIQCRLEGGPFHDDGGFLSLRDRPDMLYCVACPEEQCEAGGVHWHMGRRTAEIQAWQQEKIRGGSYSVETYRFDRLDGSSFIYVYGDPVSQGDDLVAKEAEPAIPLTTKEREKELVPA